MCLIIHIHVVDNHSLGVVGDVGGTEVANVILGILQVESVAKCPDAVLDKLRLSSLHGDGIRLVIDGRGNALNVGNREAVDAVCLCFEYQSWQSVTFCPSSSCV